MPKAAIARQAENSLDQYLREISRTPLLTRDDEIQLAKAVRAGDEQALDTLVRSNLRFVVSIAKKYQYHGLDLADLIAEGNCGLMRAAGKFDPDQGVKFISYAVWWIRQAILFALAEMGRPVRIPLNRTGTIHTIGKRASALLQALEREPTPKELATDLGIAETEIAATIRITRAPAYLDQPIGRGDDQQLAEFIADENAASPDALAIDADLSAVVENALAGYPQRTVRIIQLYFGLDGQEPQTLEQIGASLSITRERVRQIKDQALDKLRHSAHGKVLAQYAEG